MAEEQKETIQSEAEEKAPEEKPEAEDNSNTEEAEEKAEIDDNTEDDKPEDKEDNINPEDVNLEDAQAVSEALNKKGIDYDVLADEYMKNGSISEKTMKELEAFGIPSEMVNNYIAGYEARVELERKELAECVGGKEKFDEIINWAANNLKKEEIISLNGIRDKFQLEATLIGLKARMEEKEGKNPDYQKGTGDGVKITGYRSEAERFEGIEDPKYNDEPAYRDDVTRKIAASREAGIDLGIY